MKIKTINHFIYFLYLFSFIFSLIWLYIDKTAYLFANLALVYCFLFTLILKAELKTFKKAQVFGFTILQNFAVFMLFLLIFILNSILKLKTPGLNYLSFGTTLAASIVLASIAILVEVKITKGEIC